MSITLYTPATGFPDLEAKIAYGLARVGIEAYGVEKVNLKNMYGFFQIIIDGNIEIINKTFNLLCQRILSSTHIPFSTPGIAGRSAEGMKVTSDDKLDLNFYSSLTVISLNKSSETVCRHTLKDKLGNVIGFAASTSYHHSRDTLDISIQQNIPRRPTNPKKICKTCGLLSLLGLWYTSFIFNIGDTEVMIVPIPKRELTGFELQRIFSLQHQIRKEWINKNFPQRVLPLILLSQIPSSADILNGFDLFIAMLSRQQGYHVDGLYQIPVDNYLNFLRTSPYNSATVETLLNKEGYNSLEELNKIIFYQNTNTLTQFARYYTQETSGDTYINLLYPETARYLLKEVAMIKPEIIENPALESLARTLRYFIRERKYSYADDLRNARRDSRDFEETIAKMLREAELRRVQQEQERKSGKDIENRVHIPNMEDIKTVFSLAERDFEGTKLALIILAFSFPTKKEA